MTDRSQVQLSYDLGCKGDLTVATITRVFENGFKVLAQLRGDDAEAFIDAWNGRAPAQPSPEQITHAVLNAISNGGDNLVIYEAVKASLVSSTSAQPPRPRAFLAWAVQMFGPVAKLRSERLLRFVEEATELAHAEGMEREVFNRVADRVYSRPAGNVGKEIGQAQACLETFAENIGLSSADEAQREWARVQEIPQDEWTHRHAAKQAIGIALSSTQEKSPVMQAAENAAKVADGWSDSKKAYADRAVPLPSGRRQMRISLRRSKSDGRMMRVTACYDVRHGGDVLAKLQKDANTSFWFWYGMKGVSGNTASNPRQFNVVKAEVVDACKAYLASALSSTDLGGGK